MTGGGGGDGPCLQVLQFGPAVEPVLRSIHILWKGQQNKLGPQSLELPHLPLQHAFPPAGGEGAGLGFGLPLPPPEPGLGVGLGLGFGLGLLPEPPSFWKQP